MSKPPLARTHTNKMYRDVQSYDSRKTEVEYMRSKYMDRVPILVEPRDAQTPSVDKRKYMVHHDLSFGQLMYVIRKRLNMRSEQALFFFAGNSMQSATATIGSVYDRYKDEDGFLYVTYSLENTFG